MQPHTHTRRWHARVTALVAAFLLTFGLVACGGETEPEGADAESGTMATSAAADTNTIVDVAMTDDRFTTLVAALDSAGLVETLQGDGPYTVFAPTNSTFEQLPEGTLDDLLAADDKSRLRSILLYHVVEGEMMSGDISGMQTVTTMEGSELSIGATDGTVTVGDAQVTAADIEASNGVIYVIDTVLSPPEEESSGE